MKYLMVAYHNGNAIQTFETDEYIKARRFYSGSVESTAIRCFLNGKKLTYPESDRLFGFSTNQICRRLGDGEQDV